MASPFNRLPIEITKNICHHLEPSDMSALRLTGRTLGDDVTSSSFLALVKEKRVDLTDPNLRRLVRATSTPGIPCLLEHCTIRRVIRAKRVMANLESNGPTRRIMFPMQHGPSEDILQSLLTEAFRNLKQRSPNDGLLSLHLTLVVQTVNPEEHPGELWAYRDWRSVCRAAEKSFVTVMTAVRDSKLAIFDHLDIFDSVNGCSLSIDAFAAFANTNPAAFRSLKRLTLSVTDRPLVSELSPNQSIDYLRRLENNTLDGSANNVLPRMLSVLGNLPRVRKLSLYYFRVGPLDMARVREYPPPDDMDNIQPLEECTLSGVQSLDSNLVHFLQAVRPASLTLLSVRVINGSFDRILEHLRDESSPVQHYHLEDLSAASGMVYFPDEPGGCRWAHTEEAVGPTTVTRTGAAVKEPLTYHHPNGRPEGCPELALFLQEDRLSHGPPAARMYDFLSWNREHETGTWMPWTPLERDNVTGG